MDYNIIPDEYLCPISFEIMNDPIICEDGHTYEKSSIVNLPNDLSPFTRQPINKNNLIPNRVLKELIDKFKSNQYSEIQLKINNDIKLKEQYILNEKLEEQLKLNDVKRLEEQYILNDQLKEQYNISQELENQLKLNNKKNEEQYITSQDLKNKLELNNKIIEILQKELEIKECKILKYNKHRYYGESLLAIPEPVDEI
jgi:hypothetical protein